MAYYRTCDHCGSNLDPGESCDCRGNVKEQKEKAAQDATNIQDGKAEQNDTRSASIVHES